ncbi:hypothetical protein CCMA1212_007485 [Trichoderma ghanense]|uniref:Uncharacterized protein n=1 Tax=Trichoderma ghanense TaxID=65468 RepID=A0ABY2GZ46_9HYPO
MEDTLQQPTKRATMLQRAYNDPISSASKRKSSRFIVCDDPISNASKRKSSHFIVRESPTGSEEPEDSSNQPQPRPHKRRRLYRHHPLREASLTQQHDALSGRASSVLQGALEDSLLHHQMAKPIAAWSEDDFDHAMSECPRPEKKLACLIEHRLGGTLADMQLTGIGGYGEVPWCATCCLPRSRCPEWEKNDGEGERLGDDRQWRRANSETCRLYKGVVLRAVSAMLSFALPSGVTLLQQVEAWREDSRTRFNRELDLGGWLLSPMWWGSRQVMIMLRVFYQLDVAVEEAWVLKAMERRQGELSALGLQQWKDREAMASHVVVTAGEKRERQGGGAESVTARAKKTDLDQKLANIVCIRDARAQDDEQRRRRWSSRGGSEDYWREVRDRIRQWGEGGIRCQLCRSHGWDEECYRHPAASCLQFRESDSYRVLDSKLSVLNGMDEGGGGVQGEDGDDAGGGICQRCRFPVAVCRPTSPGAWSIDGSADEWGDCRGTEVMKQTVAALLARGGGKLAEEVIDSELARWEQESGGHRCHDIVEGWCTGRIGVEELAGEWMRDRVRDDGGWCPRIVRLFVRLTAVFERLLK